LGCSLRCKKRDPRRPYEIVDQNADPDAARGGELHMAQQQPGGIVLVDDVVLDVERALGVVGRRKQLAKASSPELKRRIPDRFSSVPGHARRPCESRGLRSTYRDLTYFLHVSKASPTQPGQKYHDECVDSECGNLRIAS